MCETSTTIRQIEFSFQNLKKKENTWHVLKIFKVFEIRLREIHRLFTHGDLQLTGVVREDVFQNVSNRRYRTARKRILTSRLLPTYPGMMLRNQDFSGKARGCVNFLRTKTNKVLKNVNLVLVSQLEILLQCRIFRK